MKLTIKEKGEGEGCGGGYGEESAARTLRFGAVAIAATRPLQEERARSAALLEVCASPQSAGTKAGKRNPRAGSDLGPQKQGLKGHKGDRHVGAMGPTEGRVPTTKTRALPRTGPRAAGRSRPFSLVRGALHLAFLPPRGLRAGRGRHLGKLCCGSKWGQVGLDTVLCSGEQELLLRGKRNFFPPCGFLS